MGAPAMLRSEKDVEQDRELAWQFLRYMVTMREVEDRIERKLYRQGKIVGGVYVGRGQEAIPVGVGLTAEPEDVLCPSHRDLALFLIRGVHPRQIFAQYMGRVGGLTRGKDGNMHMGDMNRRIVSIISAMAASVPVAAGAALALRYKGTHNIAYCPPSELRDLCGEAAAPVLADFSLVHDFWSQRIHRASFCRTLRRSRRRCRGLVRRTMLREAPRSAFRRHPRDDSAVCRDGSGAHD